MSITLRPARSGSSSPCRGGVWETPGVRMPPGRSIVWYQNVDATLARSSSTFTGGAAPLRRHRPVAVARGRTLYVFGANAEHTDRVERSGPLPAETSVWSGGDSNSRPLPCEGILTRLVPGKNHIYRCTLKHIYIQHCVLSL